MIDGSREIGFDIVGPLCLGLYLFIYLITKSEIFRIFTLSSAHGTCSTYKSYGRLFHTFAPATGKVHDLRPRSRCSNAFTQGPTANITATITNQRPQHPFFLEQSIIQWSPGTHRSLRKQLKSGSAIAEGPREALVSRNPTTTKHLT